MSVESTAPKTHCPPWLLALVAKVEQHEYVHPRVEEGEDCFGEVLKAVPSEVRAQAAGYVVAKREAAGGAG